MGCSIGQPAFGDFSWMKTISYLSPEVSISIGSKAVVQNKG
jgi:hypothetical protein